MSNLKKYNNLLPDVDSAKTSKDIQEDIGNLMLDCKDAKDILYIKTYLSRVKHAIEGLEKANKYKELVNKSFDEVVKEDKYIYIDGAELKMGATYTKYDFSGCGHPELNFINNLIEAFKDKMKAIEEELKHIEESKPVAYQDPETGEINHRMEGGTKDIIVDNRIINIIQEVINNSELIPGEVVTVIPPVKYQTTGVIVSKK